MAVLSTIAKVKNKSKCPWMDEWINKIWHKHTIEYYLAFKKKEILPFTATSILEDIILSETSQSCQDKYCIIHLNEVSIIVKLRSRQYNSGCQRLSRGE
jgi:hypothetical protein